jgi:hypothetical protein
MGLPQYTDLQGAPARIFARGMVMGRLGISMRGLVSITLQEASAR